MIVEQRDPKFWTGVAAHPALSEALFGASAADIAEMAAMPSVRPLASEHGGFLFSALDGLETVFELHTLYTPEGWGREVHAAAKEALEAFDWRLIVTYETSAKQSQPPRSFGFVSCGKKSSFIGELTVWSLTRPAWEASKAYRSMKCPQ